jgi:hypothetical protein
MHHQFSRPATNISNDRLGVPRNVVADKSSLEKRQNGIGDGQVVSAKV